MHLKKGDFIKQKDSMQCGAASLAMVCRYFGVRYSTDFIEKYCHTTNQGVSLKGISDAASTLGLDAKARKLTMNQLVECQPPAIIHWNQNHFVVLYKITRRGTRYHIADPGKGFVKISCKEFEDHWLGGNSDEESKGVAMFFSPTDRFGSIEDNKLDQKRSFGFLLEYLHQYRKYFIQITVGLLLGCILQLIMPFLTQWIVDIGIKHRDISFIWLILLGELMIVAGRTATDFIRRWLLLHISMRINLSLVSDFFIKLLSLPMSFFERKLSGDLMQRMSDHTRVQAFLTDQVLSLVFTCLSFVVFGIVLLTYDILIFCVFIVGSLVYGFWILSFLNKRKIIDYELFEQLAINQNKTWQFITAMQEIKLQSCELRRRWEWEDTQADLFCVHMKLQRLQQTQEAGSIFINEIKNILITVLSATAVIDGHMTLGAMLAVQYVIGQLNSPVEQLMQFVYSIQDVKISLERINEIHQGKNEETSHNILKEIKGTRSITLDEVSFKYDPHSLRNTLDKISIHIPEGRVTALVGSSGSGKTTLMKLILGYYPVCSGSLRLGDSDIGDYNLKWWRGKCGVVMQDGFIFSESIARNIAVDDGDIDYDRLECAAQIACIHDFVMGLPLRYDTKIGRDGVGLSQGQKQRVLIARAVYKNPDFIFLDEATNSLDASNEKAIVENLKTFYKGKTVLIVAHRLSTVRNADQIIVLDNGQIAEQGSHDSLINARGAYYNLIKNQLELGS